MDGMKDGIGDLSAYKALAFKVDFSDQEVDFQCAVSLFINKNNYNASRMWIKNLVGVGGNGTYFVLESSMSPTKVWTIPAGFKGVLYMDLTELDKGTNVTEEHSLATLYPYFRFYNMTGKGELTTGPVNGLIEEAYFTDTIPSVEYNTISVSVNDEVRGSYKLNPGASVVKGTPVTLTATPNTGYVVEYVKVDGEKVTASEDGSYALGEISTDKTVYVHFGYDPDADRFAWTATGDHVTVTADKEEVPNGAPVTFTVKAESGYEVTSIKINGEEVELNKKNVYTVNEVLADVTVEITTAVVESYDTELGNSFGSEVYKPTALGTIYADADSWFVSSKLASAAEAKMLGSQPYVGADLGNVSVADWSKSDVVVIRYQHYQTSAGSVNGVKFLLEDANGNQAIDTTGANVYLIDCESGLTDKVYSSAGAYISGGMVFTPASFSGYVILPVSCFKSAAAGVQGMNITGELDFTNISKVHAFTQYAYTTDANARYAIGDIYIGKLDKESLTLSELQQVWDPNAATVTTWVHGDYNDGVTADNFVFASKMESGKVYFYDYSESFINTSSALKINFSENMLVDGFADVSAIKALQLYIDNSANDKAVEYGVSLFDATGNGTEWSLNGMGKVVFYNETTQKATYCTTNTNVIPAGFKGYIYIPLDNTVFSASTGATEFPTLLKDYMTVNFPVVSVSGLANGTSMGLGAEFLTKYSPVSYEVTDTSTEYTITYVLDGGENASNSTTYKVTDNLTLAAATKEGFRFDGWYTNADFSGPVVEKLENTCGNITLYAKWGATYTITYQISVGGTMYPAVDTAEQGDTITFAIFPDDGYVIAFVSVNGTSVALTEEDTFTMENISENLTIVVEFEQEQAPVDSGDTTSDSSESGCKSTIGGLAVVATLIAKAVVLKKKED